MVGNDASRSTSIPTATVKTAADTECAQTLLQLATSTSPPVAVRDTSEPSLAKRDDQTINRERSSLSESSVKSRVLKQQLDGKAKGGQLPASWLVQCRQLGGGHRNVSPAVEPPGEMAKRIRLDHNYSRVVDDRYYSDYRHVDDYECYGDNGHAGFTRTLPSDVRSKRDVASKLLGHKKVHKRSPNKTHGSSSKAKERACDNSKLDRCKFPREQCRHANTDVFEREHKVAEATEHDLNSSADLYEPSSSKFKNFHLLMTCLSTETCMVEELSQKMHTPDIRGRDNEFGMVVADAESEFGMVAADADLKQFECICCHKSFTKRRYLTKHMRRMHPGMNILPTPKEDPILVLCPNCGNSIPRRNFRRHSTSCNTHLWKTKRQLEVDLANCQFCGVRMRRHVLVKHLAQEHCVENLKGTGDSDSDLSDADNDTDSIQSGGSGWTTCDICLEQVEDFGLLQHVAEKHPDGASSTLSEPVSCQLCGIQMTPRSLMAHLTDEHWVSPRDSSAGVSPGDDTLFSHSLLKAILDSSKRDFAGRNGSRSSESIKSVSVVGVPSGEGLDESSSCKLMASPEPLQAVGSGRVGMATGGRLSPVPVQ